MNPATRQNVLFQAKVLLSGEVVLPKAELVLLFWEPVKVPRGTGSRKSEASSTSLETGFTFFEASSAFRELFQVLSGTGSARTDSELHFLSNQFPKKWNQFSQK
jgi:hypothetical protein